MKSLNNLQKKILFVGMCVAIVMVVVPPWTSVVNMEGLHKANFEGYHFIFEPPKIATGFENVGIFSSFYIDYKLLLIQIVALIFVVISAVFSLQNSDKRKPDSV